MELNKNGTEVIVTGNVKTIDDSMALRDEIQQLVDGGASAITLRFQDSFALPSAVIGYLMKLVNRDRVRLTLLTGDQRLYVLLDDLQLLETFGVRQIG